mmetsp:Transcript_23075/g.75349  ORF Transcript_23075/g.75349 Transcript_23075/m.75349 type:complete len:356 (-) Transcript_23075:448-1515(-)
MERRRIWAQRGEASRTQQRERCLRVRKVANGCRPRLVCRGVQRARGRDGHATSRRHCVCPQHRPQPGVQQRHLHRGRRGCLAHDPGRGVSVLGNRRGVCSPCHCPDSEVIEHARARERRGWPSEPHALRIRGSARRDRPQTAPRHPERRLANREGQPRLAAGRLGQQSRQLERAVQVGRVHLRAAQAAPPPQPRRRATVRAAARPRRGERAEAAAVLKADPLKRRVQLPRLRRPRAERTRRRQRRRRRAAGLGACPGQAARKVCRARRALLLPVASHLETLRRRVHRHLDPQTARLAERQRLHEEGAPQADRRVGAELGRPRRRARRARRASHLEEASRREEHPPENDVVGDERA